MSGPARVVWEVVRGDDETLVLTITTDGSTPVDISARTYVSTVAAEPGGAAVTTATCTVTDGANGVLTMVLTDTKTDLLTGSLYWYDLVETSGSNESTLILAPMPVVRRVTA